MVSQGRSQYLAASDDDLPSCDLGDGLAELLPQVRHGLHHPAQQQHHVTS